MLALARVLEDSRVKDKEWWASRHPLKLANPDFRKETMSLKRKESSVILVSFMRRAATDVGIRLSRASLFPNGYDPGLPS
jgi:hypothetical protein